MRGQKIMKATEWKLGMSSCSTGKLDKETFDGYAANGISCMEVALGNEHATRTFDARHLLVELVDKLIYSRTFLRYEFHSFHNFFSKIADFANYDLHLLP